ncbi:IPT/TIG domain protein [Synechococcus sp. PCC 7335]|uniref:IPT/TIG domain-containing protein n=1 Tax=Synechococcus sp. (strain ATCC 29403 / PCC 7335) TaxID=91464 RepID=UPI00017EE11C|nr:IPT/TIG domain-containing protein [Synechococcus sp. PCC 7335]EDX82460.1 IPT/TIG domain protein [Synechococcus sp. PCC 7335]EDX82477.1 IPT/TIG domain protein [Synechococcus sp. PCC 7335]
MHTLNLENKSSENQFEGYNEPITAVNFRTEGIEREGQDNAKSLEWDLEFRPETIPPPVIQQLLFACAEVVILTGLITGANVILEIDGDKIETKALDGILAIEVSALDEGAQVRARQEFDGDKSNWSKTAIVVPHPRSLPAPRIVDYPYECARFVVAENLFVGARVRCEVNGSPGRVQRVKDKRQAIRTSQALSQGDLVRIIVTLCEETSTGTLEAISKTQAVQLAPNPLPVATIPKSSIVIDNDRIKVEQVLVGTGGKLSNLNTGNEEFYSNIWESSWYLLNKPIRTKDQFTFEHRLCQSGSPSAPVVVKEGDPDLGQLTKPVIARPFCPGNTIFTLYNCLPGARVGLLLDGRPVALAVAYAPTVTLAIDPTVLVRSGQKLKAFTYLVPGKVELSNEVEVIADSNVSITVDSAISYVNPDGDRRYGIDFATSSHLFVKVKSCCDEAGQIVPAATVLVNETPVTSRVKLYPAGESCFAGYVLIEEELPLGRYEVRIEGICGNRTESKELWLHRLAPGERDQQSPQLSLTVTTSDGARATITDKDRQPIQMNAWFNEQFDAVLKAEDQSGLRAVVVSWNGLVRVLSNSLVTYNYQKQSPVPTDLLMRSNWIPIGLGSLYLDAAAIDLTSFRQMSQTAQIELEIKQRTPILREVKPTSTFGGSTITLLGDFFNTPPQTTLLFYEMGVEKARIDVTASVKKTEIASVTVPQLSPGQYEISIETGPKPERSLFLPFQIKRQPDPSPPQPLSKTVALNFSRRTQFNGFNNSGQVFFVLDDSSNNVMNTTGFPFVGKVTNNSQNYGYTLSYLEVKNSAWDLKKQESLPEASLVVLPSTTTFSGLNILNPNALWALVPFPPGGLYKDSHTLTFELFDRTP